MYCAMAPKTLSHNVSNPKFNPLKLTAVNFISSRVFHL